LEERGAGHGRPTPQLPIGLRGDEERLYRAFGPELLRRTARKVEAPQTVVEEACSFAWLQFCRYQPEREHALAWLTVVARNEAWRLGGSRRRRPCFPTTGREYATEPILPSRWPTRATPSWRWSKRALRALAGLKARQRRVLTLWTAGYTYTEIAELTGSTYTWVNRYMSDGRAALRRSRDAA